MRDRERRERTFREFDRIFILLGEQNAAGPCKSDTTGAASGDGIPNGDGSDSDGSKTVNGNAPSIQAASDPKSGGQPGGASSPLSVLADVALSKEKRANKSKNGYGKAGETAADGAPAPQSAVQNGSDDGELEQPSDEEEGGEHFSTLRELLIRPAPKSGGSAKNSDQTGAPVAKRQRMETLEDVISCVIERAVDREASPDHNPPTSASSAQTTASAPAAASASPASTSTTATSSSSSTTSSSAGAASNNNKEGTNGNNAKVNGGEPREVEMELVHFKRRDVFKTVLNREALPPRIMVLCESEKVYPDIPHSWLCSGKLLRLHDPFNPNNYKLFQVTSV